MAKSEGLMADSSGMSYRKALGHGKGEGAGNFGCDSFQSVQRPRPISDPKGGAHGKQYKGKV